MFGTTIAENILYGRDGVTHAEIELAAKDANAHEFIKNFPNVCFLLVTFFLLYFFITVVYIHVHLFMYM